MGDPGPIDVDVRALDPGDFARLQITRAITGSDIAWAEIGWDAIRYGRHDEVAATYVGLAGQLVEILAAQQGKTAAELWREWMLGEATSGRSQ